LTSELEGGEGSASRPGRTLSPGKDPVPLHIFFQPHRGPGVDSAPSKYEYQEHFLGVKAAGGAWG